MPTTPIFDFEVPDDTADVELDTLIGDAVQSIEDNLPHRFAASISALGAMSGSIHPDGQIAVLTADSSGVREGAMFVRRNGAWHFMTGTIQTLSTFIGVLSSNIKTQPGGVFYDEAADAAKVFTNNSGSAILLGSSDGWVTISQKSGYRHNLFAGGPNYPFGYKLEPGGARLRGWIVRSNGLAIKDGMNFGLLPSDARPTGDVNVYSLVLGGSEGGSGRVRFGPDGTIELMSVMGRSTAGYCFDGIFIPQG